MRIALFTQIYSVIVDCISGIISPNNLIIVDFSTDETLADVCVRNGINHIKFKSWDQLYREMPGADLIVSYKLDKIIPMELVARIEHGGLNIHPSLLPKYSGANPWFHMYYNMETEGGVTIHRISEKPDAGNIIIQKPFRIAPGQPLPSAMKTADSISCDLIKAVIDGGMYSSSGTMQNPYNKRDNEKIDLDSLKFLSVDRLWHLFRGFPSLIQTVYPSLSHKYFEVGEYIREDTANSDVGSVRSNDRGCWIVCSDGLISLFDFMQIPMTSDYLESILANEFADIRLEKLTFERDQNGLLKFIQGCEAVVFPAMCDDTKVAVRFVRNTTLEQLTTRIGRLEVLQTIIQQYNLKHFPDFEIVRNAIKLSKGNFPAIIMNWIPGLSLIPFLKQNIRNIPLLHNLLREFIKNCKRNHIAGIVHGDIHSGNIIVDKNGHISIIDIFNAWHPTFGQVKDTAGNRNYQHPKRQLNKYFDEYVDYFSEIIVCVTIYVAAYAPDLFNNYCYDEGLFVAQDFLAPDESTLISALLKNQLTEPLASLIVKICHEPSLSNIPPVETINLFCHISVH